MARRTITGFRQDAAGHWVAELNCGHARHIRHAPPFEVRPWVQSADGRAAKLGAQINCGRCKTRAAT